MLKIKTIGLIHVQTACQSLHVLCHKPWAALVTVMVIAITLTLPTLFWIVTQGLQTLTRGWQSNGHITLYMKPSFVGTQQTEFIKQLRAMDGIGEVTFKSAAEGLAELEQQEGMQGVRQLLQVNPLPAIIEISPQNIMDSPEKLEKLMQSLQTLPPVDQAKLDLQWINRLHALLHLTRSFANGLLTLLAFSVVFIIGNTLRLAVQNRREEIQVLKLLGASDAFILRPFLYTGMWFGFIGAVFAILLVNLFVLNLKFAFDRVIEAYQMHFPVFGLSVGQACGLLGVAVSLGWLGARLAVNRQLALIQAAS